MSRQVLALLAIKIRADMRFPPGRWRYVQDTDEDYIVSASGLVMSRKWAPRWQRMTIWYRTKYACVILYKKLPSGPKRTKVGVHQLVLAAFGPPRPTVHHIVCHKDDDASNNSIANLYWGTCRDNQLDAIKNNRVARKLPIRTVLSVFQADGAHAEVAARFGVSYEQACNIRTGRRYADFTRTAKRGIVSCARIGPRKARAEMNFTEAEVRAMRLARIAGATYGELARQCNSAPAIVRGIAVGDRYRWVSGQVAEVTKFYKTIRNLPAPVTMNPVEHGRVYDPEHRPRKEAH